MTTGSIRARLAADPQVGAGNVLGALIAHGASLDAPTLAFDTDVDGHPAWQPLSLGSLDRSVQARAAWLHTRGVRPHDRVAVYAGHASEVVLAFLALARLGAVAALVNGKVDGATAADYLRRLGGTEPIPVLTDQHHHDSLTQHDPNAVLLGDLDELATGRLGDAPLPYRHRPDDAIAITHSSGTTGILKPITASHASQFSAIRHRLQQPRAQGAERMLSALPVAHNSTLSIVNIALAGLHELLVLSDQSGPRTLRAIDRWRPGTVLGFAVTWAELAGGDLPLPALESVRVWWNVGDCARESHIRRLIAVGNHQIATSAGPMWELGSVFIDNFDTSELDHSVLTITHDQSTDRYGRCVGRAEPYAEATVLGPDGRQAPPGEPGLLGVRSAAAPSGSPSESPSGSSPSGSSPESPPGSQPASPESWDGGLLDGWRLTGDLVYRDDDGYFYHLDRVTDAVQAPDGSRLYTALTEELVLASCPDVQDCTVVASVADGHAVADVLLQLKPGADPTIDRTGQVRAVLDKRVAAAVRRVDVVDGDQIPVSATGKVRKRALRDSGVSAA